MTKLEKAIKELGGNVVCYVNGQYAPWDKRSNVYKAILDAGYEPSDIGSKIMIAVGAHRRNGPDGWKMAVVQI